MPIWPGSGRKYFPTGKTRNRSLLPFASGNWMSSHRGHKARPQPHFQHVLISEKILLFGSSLGMECLHRACGEQAGHPFPTLLPEQRGVKAPEANTCLFHLQPGRDPSLLLHTGKSLEITRAINPSWRGRWECLVLLEEWEKDIGEGGPGGAGWEEPEDSCTLKFTSFSWGP